MGCIPGPVVGCGSVVVDIFHALQRFPTRGAKAYVARGAQQPPRRTAGGVGLNQLAWAAALARTPVALLARIGPPATDPDAALVLRAMRAHGVDDRHVVCSPAHRTPTSLVFTDNPPTPPRNTRRRRRQLAVGQEDEGDDDDDDDDEEEAMNDDRRGPERTIIMDPASTAGTTPEMVRDLWTGAIHNASVVSTEVSQLPLAAACEVLRLAREAHAITVLDVDVPPEVACRDENAGLGTPDQLLTLLALADVIKPSHHVALALCRFLGSFGSSVDAKHDHHQHLTSNKNSNDGGRGPECAQEVVAKVLVQALPVRPSLLVVTDGPNPAVAVTKGGHQVAACLPRTSPTPGADPIQIDVTGSGDAFTGGCLAWIYHNQCIPENEASLEEMLTIANVCGRACSHVMHSALPLSDAHEFGQHLARQHQMMAQFLSQFESRRPESRHVPECLLRGS